MDSKEKPVRVALLGCGRVAQRVHAPILARLPGAVLDSVADPSADAKVIASRLNPGVRLFDSVNELLDTGGFDAACVCLPTHLHAEYAVRVLKLGVPLYLEKPLATSETEAAQILSAWQDQRLTAMVGFNYRFHPLHARIRNVLDSGRIGRLTAVRTLFSTPPRTLPHWKRSRTSGGGVLLDLFSHHADLVLHHTGQRAISASATTRSVSSEDDNAHVTWTLESGLNVQSTVSMTGAEMDRIEFIGENGSVLADRLRGSLTLTPRSHSATTPEMLTRSFGLAWNQLVAFRPRLDPSFVGALSAFVHAARTGQGQAPDLLDGWRSLAVVLSAIESAANESRSITIHSEPQPSNQRNEPEQEPPPSIHLSNVTDDPGSPALSVVLVTVKGMPAIQRVLQFLSRQTIAERLQLIIIAPDAESLDLQESSLLSRFNSCTPVYVGAIEDVDLSAAKSLPHARAPFITFLEDHAFPAPDWAERIVETAHSGPWDAVGTRIENGNPGTVLSWANMLMSYGSWVAAEHAGTTTNIARHNSTFRKSTLEREYGSELPSMMGRDGGLLNDLLARGAIFYLTPDAHVEHLNPSTWRSTLQLRIGSGRLFASSRMKKEHWSFSKRLMYIMLGAAIPFIRFRILREELLTSQTKANRIGWRAYPALAVGVILDGIGQFLGHTIGPGNVKQKLAFFEISRARHLRSSERHLMSGDAP